MIIWGTRTKREGLGFVLERCMRCGNETIHFVAQSKTKFTLYFVPTFTTSTKALLICTVCERNAEVGGPEGKALLERALPREEMLALLQKRAGTGQAESDVPPSRALAIATVAAAMVAAGADGRIEENEAAAVGYALKTISESTLSTPVRAAADLASTDFGSLVEYVASPMTEPIPVMLARAGSVARRLPEPDQYRFVGQLSWLCHTISNAASGAAQPALDAMDIVLEQLGFTPREIAAALAFCEGSGG